jgi:hypothetical protein
LDDKSIDAIIVAVPDHWHKQIVVDTAAAGKDDYDDLRPHLWKFFEAVRKRKPVVQDVVFGHHAALVGYMANESYYRKSRVYWDAWSQISKS